MVLTLTGPMIRWHVKQYTVFLVITKFSAVMKTLNSTSLSQNPPSCPSSQTGQSR